MIVETPPPDAEGQQLAGLELTPTQELVVEVLVARLRLGERCWPFPRRSAITVALRQLEEAGAITFRPGNVEHTWITSLTDAGERCWTAAEYHAPALRELDQLRTENIGLRAALRG